MVEKESSEGGGDGEVIMKGRETEERKPSKDDCRRERGMEGCQRSP